MIFGQKYRIYPSEEQKILLEKHFGCTRLVYNLGLECKSMAWNGSRKSLSYFDMTKQLPELKAEYDFLKEVSAQSLYSALRNLDTAYKNFFRGSAKFPKFKPKKSKQSFQLVQYVAVEKNKLYIPKFREGVKIVLHRPIKGLIKTTTISRTPTNKYFVSFVIQTKEDFPEKKIPSNAVGLDLGIKSFVVLSNGTKFNNPQYLRNSLDKLKWLQRRSSKKKQGSNRSKRFRLRVARQHEKIANQRKELLHKVSDAITKQYDTICIENLQVANMVKNHNLALSISDCGWGMFEQFLKYKADWRGVNIVQIGTFEPSSKTCSDCGYINPELELKDREWLCPNCGSVLDRDLNAAKNILKFGLKTIPLERRDLMDAELPALVGAVKRQKFLGTHFSASKKLPALAM
ncbi:MAG: RNA-guided endonuclease TnpB family protein [Melioribacteraceae bacterium]|nr:RNA-guided endonuclease TnpB family protein [Melioribacteraceae bacterium]